MKRICVFAGSNVGEHPAYIAHARELGQVLVANNLELVYGGSRIGLMGEIANVMLELGGKATGVMPKGLFRGEMVHDGLTELIEVNSMHERKAKMGELADGFIALPGGYGTFEELFEVVSWLQLGIHRKPVGVLNIEEYYTPLLQMVSHAAAEGFMNPVHTGLLLSAASSAPLIDQMKSFQPPDAGNKWKQLSEE